MNATEARTRPGDKWVMTFVVMASLGELAMRLVLQALS